jgi:2',3'-cyclic-nucleotide 2'-phosphodiesterase (5'-nucleotidase family)
MFACRLGATRIVLRVFLRGVLPALLPQPKPYIVLETTNGLTIAVLGLSVATAKEGVRSRDAVAVAREYLYLRQKHPLLVGLTHLGFRTDQRLAEAVGSFDVILGGHSHTLVDPATRVSGVLIAQAAGTPSTTPAHPNRPKYLGQVELVLENEQVVEKRGQVFTFLAPESAASVQTVP